MNKTKLIFIGLLIAYSIYLIITLVTSDISGMIETRFGIKEVVIMFPIVVIFVALMWAWIFPKFSRRLKDPNYPVPFPNMRNKLSESPLEWIYMLAFFFIIPSIALELSTLVGHGTFYGIGFLGIAYGLGLIGSIYLILRKKANGV